MSRYARRREPAIRPKTRLEVSDEHLAIRVICLVVALVVAAVAFGTALNSVFSTKTGWQQIEPVDHETGIAQDFLLYYNIGKSDQSPRDELRAVSSGYSKALDHAYRVLSNVEVEGYVNLHTLNTQPNTDITVDALVYNAFAQVEEAGSRLPYFAPLMEQYHSLFACGDDAQAEHFDPERSEAAAQFAGEIAAFANDPEAVQVRLLPGNTLRLEVSQKYLDYARENEVDSFVDFGILLNAFLCDAVADTLEEQGCVNGYITSFDGFTRAMCTDEFGLNVLDLVQGQARQLGTVLYNTPGAVVSCRSFPVLEKDAAIYYTYSDGSIRAPYLNDQGLLSTACASLNSFSGELSTAELALRALAAYAGEDEGFSGLEDLSWVAGSNQQILLHGEAFRPAE